MLRDVAKTLAFIAALGLTSGPVRALAEGFVHVVVVTDDRDPKIGESVKLSGSEFAGVFRNGAPPARYSIRRVGGASLGPESILAAIQALPVTAGEDTVVVYSASHGGYDPVQGSYLSFPATRRTLLRSELKGAILAKQGRLGVLITESCNEVRTILSPPALAAPGAAPPPNAFSPVLRALFLSHSGFVDLASSRRGERSLCYPKLRNNLGTQTLRGAVFTEALVGSVQAHFGESLTWVQLADEVAPTVRDEFLRLQPDGLEDPNDPDPDKAQRTQTVVLYSTGEWSPRADDQGPGPGRGRLGIKGRGLAGVGVQITEVTPGSPAALIGLEPGDMILTINGVGVDTSAQSIRLINESPRLMVLTLRDVRTGKDLRSEVNLGDDDQGGGPPPPPSKPRFGAVAVAQTGGGAGLFVTHLVPGSAAARIGLEYGDIISQINGQAITDQESYQAAVQSSERVMTLTIINVRTGQPQTSKVTLDY